MDGSARCEWKMGMGTEGRGKWDQLLTEADDMTNTQIPTKIPCASTKIYADDRSLRSTLQCISLTKGAVDGIRKSRQAMDNDALHSYD